MNSTVITIIVALLGGSGIWTLIQFYLNAKREDAKEIRENKLGKLVDAVNEIAKSVNHINERLDVNGEITLSLCRDKLNHLCNKYLKEGVVYGSELVAFKELGKAYLSCGGNTEVAEKFKACEDLDVDWDK